MTSIRERMHEDRSEIDAGAFWRLLAEAIRLWRIRDELGEQPTLPPQATDTAAEKVRRAIERGRKAAGV